MSCDMTKMATRFWFVCHGSKYMHVKGLFVTGVCVNRCKTIRHLVNTTKRSTETLPIAVNYLRYIPKQYCASATHICWKCSHSHGSHTNFCEKCNVLQEPATGLTHFDVMGLSKNFVIDTKELTRTFRGLQRQFHPDKYTQKSEKEKQLSELHSSAVNNAYNTLLKPMPRGLYLLELHGFSLEEGEIQMDPVFLMEIMETNEAIVDAKEISEIRKIGAANEAVLEELIHIVSTAFENQDIARAKQTLAKLKYYANIDDKVREIERRNMEIVD